MERKTFYLIKILSEPYRTDDYSIFNQIIILYQFLSLFRSRFDHHPMNFWKVMHSVGFKIAVMVHY